MNPNWNGRDIIYPVSPGERFRMVNSMLADAPYLDEIYKELRKHEVFKGKKALIKMNRQGYAKVPTRWRKKESLFGVPVELCDQNELFKVLTID